MTDPLEILYEAINKQGANAIKSKRINPFITVAGDKIWYNDAGQVHRDDGPAVIRKDGTKEWYQHNLLHRDNGPAVENPDGTLEWFKKNVRHREDGPAIEYSNGDKYWWIKNGQHREDGPAVIRTDGTKGWWLDDKKYTEDQWLKDERVQKALAFKKLEDKGTTDDDFLRTFGKLL